LRQFLQILFGSYRAHSSKRPLDRYLSTKISPPRVRRIWIAFCRTSCCRAP
jgi:hypothetical protein